MADDTVAWCTTPESLTGYTLAETLPYKVTLHGNGIQFYLKSFYYVHLVRAELVVGTDIWDCKSWHMELPASHPRPAGQPWDTFLLPLEVEASTAVPRLSVVAPKSLSSYEWSGCRAGYLSTYTEVLPEAEYNTLYALAINMTYADAAIHTAKGPYSIGPDGTLTPISAANPLPRGANILRIAK